MLTGSLLTVAGARIAQFTKTNENSLAESLLRLASGRRVNQPSEGVGDFFHSERMNTQYRSNLALLQGIGEGRAFVDVAVAAGERVFNGVQTMKELVERYYHSTTTDDDRTAIAAEFNALKTTMTTCISSTTYDGLQVVSDNGGIPFRSVSIDANDLSQRIEISFDSGDIADVTALELGVTDEATETAAVDAELGKAGSYLAKTSAYMRGLNAHYNLTTVKATQAAESAERAVEADTGEEMVQSINKSIRNQSSMAMMAQANLFRGSVLMLLGIQ